MTKKIPEELCKFSAPVSVISEFLAVINGWELKAAVAEGIFCVSWAYLLWKDDQSLLVQLRLLRRPGNSNPRANTTHFPSFPRKSRAINALFFSGRTYVHKDPKHVKVDAP